MMLLYITAVSAESLTLLDGCTSNAIGDRRLCPHVLLCRTCHFAKPVCSTCIAVLMMWALRTDLACMAYYMKT